MSHAELASSYAALILADDGLEITVRSFRRIETVATRESFCCEARIPY